MKKIRVLPIGCGVISKHWLQYTVNRADLEIVGLVDIHPEAAQKAKEIYGINAPVFTDMEEAIKATKPDLVYDLTYVTTHVNVSVKAMELGCHVFSEKPLCMSREEAKKMIETSERTKKAFSVMQNRRYQKAVQAMRDAVRSGELGDIWMVNADIFVGSDLASIRNTLSHPMLQDNCIHYFDTIRYITGAEPIKVYCESYNPKDSKYKGDAAGTCIFEMSDGSRAVYSCTMGTAGLRTSWEARWRVSGSKGAVEWDGFGEPVKQFYHQPEQPCTTDWNGQEQHYGCLDEMFEAFLAGRPSATDIHDNYKSMCMVFSSLESAAEQRKINVE